MEGKQHLQLGELTVCEEAKLALHNIMLAHLHCAARQQLCHKQRRWQLLQIPVQHSSAITRIFFLETCQDVAIPLTLFDDQAFGCSNASWSAASM